MELKNMLKEFLFDCEAKNYTKRTIKSYKNNNALFYNFLLQEIRITELEQIKSIHIKKYLKFLLRKGCKSTYANEILKTIRAFLKYCISKSRI